MILKTNIDEIIEEIKKFEELTNRENYEKARELIHNLNVGNEFDEDIIFSVIWRLIKIKKSNKRIYRVLNKLDYTIKGVDDE